MPSYQYQVVPFVGDAAEGDRQAAAKVAKQLQGLIDKVVATGWEFYRVDQVQIVVRPGCLGALIGMRPTTMALDMVTFRRSVPD